MKYFYAVVHKDVDSAFGVTFPDLPGCFSAADDIQGVMANACDALALWFQDAADVTPMSLEQARNVVADDLADGAFLIAVPRIKNDNRSTRLNISMDAGMAEAIDKAATERSLTRSAFIAQAARNEIERRH